MWGSLAEPHCSTAGVCALRAKHCECIYMLSRYTTLHACLTPCARRIRFLSAAYSSIYICGTGTLTLGTALPGTACPSTAQATTATGNPPLIAPMWSDLVFDGNDIFCGGANSGAKWDIGSTSIKVDMLVQSSNATGASSFQSSSYIAVTWRGARYGSTAISQACSSRLTFQVVIARSSDATTFVVLQVRWYMP